MTVSGRPAVFSDPETGTFVGAAIDITSYLIDYTDDGTVLSAQTRTLTAMLDVRTLRDLAQRIEAIADEASEFGEAFDMRHDQPNGIAEAA